MYVCMYVCFRFKMADGSDVFTLRLVCTTIFFWSSVVAAAVNVEKVYSEMDIVSRLRKLTKDSVKSGKIKKISEEISTPFDSLSVEGGHCDRHDPNFWIPFENKDSDWTTFENNEHIFRMCYSTKPLTVTDRYTHPEPCAWIRLFNLIHAIFFKDNILVDKRPDGKPFSIEFLKFIKRILKSSLLTLPNIRSTPYLQQKELFC